MHNQSKLTQNVLKLSYVKVIRVYDNGIKTKGDKMKKIKLSKFEKQSKYNRVQNAEGLILQLPKTHDGRNTWLLNYGIKEEAQQLRLKRNISFDEKTMSSIYKGDE